MAKKNAYLARREALAQYRLQRQLAIHTQIAADAAAIAANEIFHMGPTRAPEFHRVYQETYLEILQLINEDTRDLEYTKETLDRRLRTIFGENFAPYDVRYGAAMDKASGKG